MYILYFGLLKYVSTPANVQLLRFNFC